MSENIPSAIIRWPHSAGGSAYCLGRLVLRPLEAPVIVLTELAGNPDVLGLSADFGGAATAAYRRLADGIDPQSIVWLAQHGEFSSYDAAGAPETLTEVAVRFDGQRFSCDLTDLRLLPFEEAVAWQQALRLQPVAAVLATVA